MFFMKLARSGVMSKVVPLAFIVSIALTLSRSISSNDHAAILRASSLISFFMSSGTLAQARSLATMVRPIHM